MFDRELTKSRIESLLTQKQAFDKVTSVMGLQPESPLNESFYSIFRTACIAVEHAALGKAPTPDEGGEGWIDWFVWEADCGERGQEAGYDGNMKPVRTVDDLLDLMEEWLKRES